MSSRKRSIPYKIVSILILPLVSVLALSALAASHALDRSWVALDVAAGAVGLTAVAASIVIAVRVTRKIVADARVMTAGVYDFSQRRLPMIAERVRQGIETHGSWEAPDYFFSTKEIQTLLEAFIFARDAAVKATVDEATMRRGVGEVFVNLARRSQALLHRQLSLLDGMERRAGEPEELEDLFRLDHLATRMRRHAEGLVILSGRAPARGWRNPVPFVDVARGAVGEVEDYTRVVVAPMPGAALTGRAVADVIHLLAELIENATAFSPPHTSVQVSGQLVGNGFALEIEDRGLGLSTEHLAAINDLLADPPEFDLSESSRLGLFVVGHLAKRQGLRVSLRPSPYGGTTAIILVPSALVVDPTAAPERTPEQTPEPAVVGAAKPTDTASSLAAPETTPTTDPALGASSPERPEGTPAGSGPGPVRDEAPMSSHPQGRHALGQQPLGQTGEDPSAEDRPAADPPREDELPRRVRQENMAPQLRGDPSTPTDEPSSDADTERSPEDVRATMAALQTGWLRGRNEGVPETDAGARPSRRRSRPANEENG